MLYGSMAAPCARPCSASSQSTARRFFPAQPFRPVSPSCNLPCNLPPSCLSRSLPTLAPLPTLVSRGSRERLVRSAFDVPTLSRQIRRDRHSDKTACHQSRQPAVRLERQPVAPPATITCHSFVSAGPYIVTGDPGGQSPLVANPYSWHKKASILYVESPAGFVGDQ